MMNFFKDELLPLLTAEIEVVLDYLRTKRLLHCSMSCDYCSHEMKEIKASRNQDRYVWKCLNILCEKRKTTISIRKNSFFEVFRLTLQDCLLLVYCWFDETSIKKAAQKTGCSRVTAIKFYQYLRNLVIRKFNDFEWQLGGENIIVQIDESMFRHKPKHHRGRATDEEIWVFGLVDTSYSPCKGFMCIVDDRSQATLLDIIGRICLPGTRIWSDQWRGYRNIEQRLGFAHETVNHKLHFVAPQTGVHTQAIESYWNKQKNRIKKMMGVRKEFLADYLKEWMVRDNLIKDDINQVLTLLRLERLII